MPACTTCNEDVPAEATFCPHCGTKFAAPPPARSAADPFSHTVPADPEELARVRDMIAAQQSSPPLPPPAPVPVRERQFGKTKALPAVEERRSSPPGADSKGARERTLASPAIAPPRVPPPPPPPPPPAAAAAPSPAAPPYAPPPPRAPLPTPSTEHQIPAVSPRAATTAQPAVHVVGAPVKVMWTDGNAYPATIVQVTPTHCSVRFANGALQWVEHGKVLPA